MFASSIGMPAKENSKNSTFGIEKVNAFSHPTAPQDVNHDSVYSASKRLMLSAFLMLRKVPAITQYAGRSNVQNE